ncbi:MAG: ATP-dependent DNA helicase RecG [Dehalococcoidia bacterium]|nr:ATP-dependent DNA helicase RecG [Dehalococcoidia bacterium]
MPLDSSRLKQVLEQEKKLEYTNKAVFGGLDKFLENWLRQNTTHFTQLALLKNVRKLMPPIFSYNTASPADRRSWMENILVLLQQPEKTVTGYSSKKTGRTSSTVGTPDVADTASVSLDYPITVVKGIAESLARRFAKLGIHTLRDMLYFFPNRHVDYSQLRTISQLRDGGEQTIIANVWEVRQTMLGGRRGTEATLGDESGNMRAVWFNNPYVARQMKSGTRICVSGHVRIFAGRPVFESPEWELVDEDELVHTGRLVPFYPLTSGLYQRQVRKLFKAIVDAYSGSLTDFMPAQLLARNSMMNLPEAVRNAHFPVDTASGTSARNRLAFDELFLLQIGMAARKRSWQKEQPGIPFKIDKDLLEQFLNTLPFSLTNAQQRVAVEIMDDLKKSTAMSRLLQGDVGSGKTVVTLMALLETAANGYQGALMAPTEILASQHFAGICRMLGAAGKLKEQNGLTASFTEIGAIPILTVALVNGDIKDTTKRELKKRLAAGEINIAIGTHALIQKGMVFQKLGLAVIDEQHRFGVEQRSLLRQKGFNPHMLVTTATPIPRTLALTLYGDLDLSVIEEMPSGRQQIKTKWVPPPQRDAAYRFMREQVSKGYQAFIICPLVEESEAVQAKSAVTEFNRLSTHIFPDLRLSLLHGRMSSSEKDAVMGAFKRRESDVLVSTAVVEVGIDIPNATVMMIESADRFGLSQLHQFRGRVGRGDAQSYCMLMSDNPSEIGKMRLDIIEKTQDGFKLADEDLKLRGPGEFFGTRQSGMPSLRIARITDTFMLELARREADLIFETDPDIRHPEHLPLAKELARVWGQKSGEWS